MSASAERGPKVRVTSGEGCPRSLGRAVDVANAFPGRVRALVPIGPPQAGLICEYGPAATGTATTHLRHTVVLGQANARRLAAAASGVSLAPARGQFACPADHAGAIAVIALRYPATGTVDLWYDTAGCRTLDNGDVLAFQGANTSFFDGFEPVFNSMAPAP